MAVNDGNLLIDNEKNLKLQRNSTTDKWWENGGQTIWET